MLSEQGSELKGQKSAEGEQAKSDPKSNVLSGRQIAALLRGGNRIDAKVLKAHQAALAPAILSRPEKIRPGLQPGARPLTFRGARTEPLTDTMMVLLEGNKVEAHAVNDENGKVLWPAELRLLGDLAVEQKAVEIPVNQASPRSDSLRPGPGRAQRTDDDREHRVRDPRNRTAHRSAALVPPVRSA